MAETTDPPTGPTEPAGLHATEASVPPVALFRASALMSVGTALSRTTGFARVAVIAWAIGATASADSYNLANSVPNMVYQLVIGEVLSNIFVPVFVEYIKTRARDESWHLASSIMNLSLVFAGVFSAITVLGAPLLIRIFTFHAPPGLRAQQNADGAFFLRLFMPQMIFYAAGIVFTGLLNAYRKFGAPMFAPILNNVIVIGTFVIFHHTHSGPRLTRSDKFLLGGGTTLGVIAMTLVLLPSVRALPGRLSARAFAWRDPAIRRVGTLAKYSLGYVASNQVALWVVLALATGTTGGVTVFQYAFILYQLPYAIFGVSIQTFLGREMSEHHVHGDLAAMRRDVSVGLRSSALIVLPASAGFIALSRPIIRLLLEHGSFDAAATKSAADTFALMTISLVAFAAFQQLMRAFYSMQDTRTPFYVNLATNGANIVAAIPMYHWLGVPGLGLAHSVSYFTGTAVGGAVLRARLGGIDGPRVFSAHARITAAAAATGAVAWSVARAIAPHVHLATTPGRLLEVGPAVAAGVAMFVIASRALRVDELRPLMALLGRRA